MEFPQPEPNSQSDEEWSLLRSSEVTFEAGTGDATDEENDMMSESVIDLREKPSIVGSHLHLPVSPAAVPLSHISGGDAPVTGTPLSTAVTGTGPCVAATLPVATTATPAVPASEPLNVVPKAAVQPQHRQSAAAGDVKSAQSAQQSSRRIFNCGDLQTSSGGTMATRRGEEFLGKATRLSCICGEEFSQLSHPSLQPFKSSCQTPHSEVVSPLTSAQPSLNRGVTSVTPAPVAIPESCVGLNALTKYEPQINRAGNLREQLQKRKEQQELQESQLGLVEKTKRFFDSHPMARHAVTAGIVVSLGYWAYRSLREVETETIPAKVAECVTAPRHFVQLPEHGVNLSQRYRMLGHDGLATGSCRF